MWRSTLQKSYPSLILSFYQNWNGPGHHFYDIQVAPSTIKLKIEDIVETLSSQYNILKKKAEKKTIDQAIIGTFRLYQIL